MVFPFAFEILNEILEHQLPTCNSLVIFSRWNLWISSLSHKRPHNVSLIFHCLTFVSLLLFSFPTTINLFHSIFQWYLTNGFVRFSQFLLAWWLCFIVMFFFHILLHYNFNLFFWFESKGYFKRFACQYCFKINVFSSHFFFSMQNMQT